MKNVAPPTITDVLMSVDTGMSDDDDITSLLVTIAAVRCYRQNTPRATYQRQKVLRKIHQLRTNRLRAPTPTAARPLLFNGQFNGVDVKIMLDSGASSNCVKAEVVQTSNTVVDETNVKQFTVANGERITTAGSTTASLTLNKKIITDQAFHVMTSLPCDVIIGMPFLITTEANVRWKQRTMNIQGQTVTACARASKAASKIIPEQFDFLMSLAQVQREERKGNPLYLLQVTDTNSHMDGEVDDQDERLRSCVCEEYADVFAESLPPGLPPERHIDHEIHLTDDKPEYRPAYRLSPNEQDELNKQLTQLIDNGLIEPACSPWGAPVLFAPKKNGKLRMCIDYRALNSKTVKDRFPLPRIDDCFDKLQGTRYFTLLDLTSGYWNVRVRPEDRHKTAFNTRYGSYQWRVLPFGLCNAPGTFQRLMTNVFRDMIDQGVTVYLDDIMIASKTKAEHIIKVKQVLERLRENKLYANKDKCVFGAKRLRYLGHVVSEHGIGVDQDKVNAIAKMKSPVNLSDTRKFLGMASYYRSYVRDFSTIAAPLTNLQKKNARFEWTEDQQTAFDALKHALTHAPVLMAPDYDKEFELDTDASLIGIGAVLSQKDDDGNLKPVMFMSERLSETESNYPTHEREFLAIVKAMRKWRVYLDTNVPFIVHTDHNPLVHVKTQANLSKRMARWVETISSFNFTPVYKPGRRMDVPDALSRLFSIGHDDVDDDARNGACDAHDGTRCGHKNSRCNATTTQVPRKNQKNRMKGDRPRGTKDQKFDQCVDDQGGDEGVAFTIEDYHTCEHFGPIFKKLRSSTHKGRCAMRVTFEETTGHCVTRDNILWKKNENAQKGQPMWRICVPHARRGQVIAEHHNCPYAGHRGCATTLERIGRNFTWKNMAKDIQDYVRTCVSCQRNKPTTTASAGLYQPLEIPQGRWHTVSLDFMTHLPKTKRGYDAITVFVDTVTKRAHFEPSRGDDTAKDVANMYVRAVFKQHGICQELVSDRDPKFISSFWRQLQTQLGTRLKMSTAHRPQSDGQTERVNRNINEYLRAFVNHEQNDWDLHLHLAEYAYNDASHSSTGQSPFLLDTGRHPVTPNVLNATDVKPTEIPAVNQTLKDWRDILEKARTSLQDAQNRQAVRINQHRRPREYVAGNEVMVSTAHILSDNERTRPANKWLPKYLGPFQVLRKVSTNAYKIDFPQTIRVHGTVNVEALKDYRKPCSLHAPSSPPPPVQVGSDVEYEIEKLLSKRKRGRGWQYLVKWKGYPDHDNSWISAKELKNNASKTIQEFETNNS